MAVIQIDIFHAKFSCQKKLQEVYNQLFYREISPFEFSAGLK